MLSKANISNIMIHKHCKEKGCEKIYNANTNQKESGMTILMSEKLDFRAKKITQRKERHYILIKS